MAVYIGMGADPVAILATSVMAAPCSLYLSKLLLPETGAARDARHGQAAEAERPHRNVIDAAAAGASDGLLLGPQRRRHADRLHRLHRPRSTSASELADRQASLGMAVGDGAIGAPCQRFVLTMLGFSAAVLILRRRARCGRRRLMQIEGLADAVSRRLEGGEADRARLGYFLFLGVIDLALREPGPGADAAADLLDALLAAGVLHGRRGEGHRQRRRPAWARSWPPTSSSPSSTCATTSPRPSQNARCRLATYALTGLRQLRVDRHPARRHRRHGPRIAAPTWPGWAAGHCSSASSPPCSTPPSPACCWRTSRRRRRKPREACA